MSDVSVRVFVVLISVGYAVGIGVGSSHFEIYWYVSF